MLRVLQCIGSLGFGGSQTFTMGIYRSIDRSKLQFDFVVFPENITGFYDEVKALGGQVYVCPRFSVTNSIKFVEWWYSFFKEHSEYTIIHGHVRSVATIYLYIAKKFGLSTIIHSHSTSNGKGIGAVIKGIMQKPLRRMADYLFSCSDYAGEWLYGKKAILLPSYRMVPNCVSCERFMFSEETRKTYRMQYNINERDFVIGHIGRFREVKNHGFIIDVFASVLSHKPDAKLLLVGDGELRKQTEDYAEAKGVRDNVLFVGAHADTENYYAMMDVFLLPSLWEGLPVCAVEAQASGLPCLLSDTITRDVNLTDQVIYVPLEKGPEEWAQTVLRFIDRPRSGVNEEKSEKLLQFDSAHVAKQLQEFYLSIG